MFSHELIKPNGEKNLKLSNCLIDRIKRTETKINSMKKVRSFDM